MPLIIAHLNRFRSVKRLCNFVEHLGHFDGVVPSLAWRQNNMASVVETTPWKHLEIPFPKLLIFKMSLDAWISLITALDLLKSKYIHPRNLNTLSSPSDCLHDWTNWDRQKMPAKNAGRKGGRDYIFCSTRHVRVTPLIKGKNQLK